MALPATTSLGRPRLETGLAAIGKRVLAAFVVVGVLGSFAEWPLLDPHVGYDEFTHRAYYRRLPA